MTVTVFRKLLRGLSGQGCVTKAIQAYWDHRSLSRWEEYSFCLWKTTAMPMFLPPLHQHLCSTVFLSSSKAQKHSLPNGISSSWLWVTTGQADNYFYLLWAATCIGTVTLSHEGGVRLDWAELVLCGHLCTGQSLHVGLLPPYGGSCKHLASDGCLGLFHVLVIITKRRVIWDIHMQCILHLLFNENAI